MEDPGFPRMEEPNVEDGRENPLFGKFWLKTALNK